MLNCNLFLWSKLYFQHHYCSLQCHMIFRNHNNMLICCSRNISDYYQCWKQLCCTIFLWKLWCILFFSIHRLTERSKEQHLFEIEKHCINLMHPWLIKYTNSKLLNGYISWFPQKYCAAQLFSIQKCFLSSKSVYYYDFWRSCDTEDWSNDAENTALITEINYSLTHIHIENTCFKFK